MLTAGVNVSFLRSGRQFGDAAMSAPDNQAPGPKLSSSQRLAQFFRRTQHAAAEAKVHREAQGSTASVAGLNLEFIQSGRQFLLSQTTEESPEALVAFLRGGRRLSTTACADSHVAATETVAHSDGPDQGPEALLAFLRKGCDFGAAPPPRRSRLDDFVSKTQQAAANARRQGKAPAPPINIAFLRSGQQFGAAGNTPASANRARLPRQRLRDFVAKTARASAVAAHRAALHEEPGSGTPGINLAFLRSGRQFVDAGVTCSSATRAREPGQRLRDFVAKTASAAARAPGATEGKGASVADQSPEALVVFLRTGQHLDATAPAAGSTLRHAAPPHDDTSDASPETIIAFLRSARRLATHAQTSDPAPGLNIAFLRSGRQFEEPLAASPASYLLEQLTAGALQQPGDRLRHFVAQTQAAAAAAAVVGSATAQGPAGPPALNVAFLRSGIQFAEARTTISPLSSRRQRLRQFVEDTAKASAAGHASPSGKRDTAPHRPEYGRKTDNAAAQVQEASWNAERDPRDEYARDHGRPAFKRTRAQRLEEFYKKTLAAASPRTARKIHAAMAADVSGGTPHTTYYPLAGRPTPSLRAPAREDTGPRRTKQQRLESFYQRTLAAASPREARWMRARVEAPTIANLKYLQSGFGFLPNTTGPAAALGAPWSESPAGRDESGSIYEEEAVQRTPAVPRTTKADRVKAFYTATQQCATKASRLASQPVT